MNTLPDRRCSPGGVLLIGINPAPVSVAHGHYYQGTHGKRLWARLTRLGLLAGATVGREDDAFVAAGNGLTDLVKRPTAAAAELTPRELSDGVVVLRNKIREWRPGLVLFAYRPPAELLCGHGIKPGRCGEVEGVPAFLLSGPYAPAEEAARVNGELAALLSTLASVCTPTLAGTGAPALAMPERTLARSSSDTATETAERTQRVTATDLSHRQIRLPRASKRLFPASRSRVQVDLRGELLEARYDPRVGPDRERSATLIFSKIVTHLVSENEVLRVHPGTGGVVSLR